MKITLSQKLSCLNYGVQSSTVTVICHRNQDGSFYVWARNLDRALSLQAKQGTSLAFNLRNYEVDFVNDNAIMKAAA